MTAHAAATPSARSLSLSGVVDAATYWTATAGVASLFTYLGVTAVLLALVKMVPPFRGEA